MSELEIFINYLKIFKSIMMENNNVIELIQKYNNDRNLNSLFLLSELGKYDEDNIKFINSITVYALRKDSIEKKIRDCYLRFGTFFLIDIESILKITISKKEKIKFELILKNWKTRISLMYDSNGIFFSYGSSISNMSYFDIGDLFQMDFNDESFDEKAKENYILYKLSYGPISDITGIESIL